MTRNQAGQTDEQTDKILSVAIRDAAPCSSSEPICHSGLALYCKNKKYIMRHNMLRSYPIVMKLVPLEIFWRPLALDLMAQINIQSNQSTTETARAHSTNKDTKKSINLLNKQNLIQVRLRSRRNPGEPFVGLKKYKNYWSDNLISRAKRFFRPFKAYRLIGTSTY